MMLFANGYAADSALSVITSQIHLEGEILFVLSVDLNSNGPGEVAIGWLGEKKKGLPEKKIAFYQSKDGYHYGPQPIFKLTLPIDSGVIGFCETNGDGRPDLVVTRRGGVWAFLQRGDGSFEEEPVLILVYPYNLPYSKNKIFSCRIFLDLNHDGRDDLFLPTMTGYALFFQGADWQFSPEPDQVLTLDYGADVIEMSVPPYLGIHYWLPLPIKLDHNQDGILDLAFADGNTFFFFPFDPHTASYGGPNIVRIPVEKRINSIFSSLVDDFDADGLPDILIMRGTPKKITTAVEHFFFKGRPGLSFGKKEDLYIFQERQIKPPLSVDLNGNDNKELITFSQRFSLNTIVDLFIRNRVVVDIAVYCIQDGLYGKRPSSLRKVALKLEEEGRPCSAFGDFNGDGLKDLAYASSAGRFSLLISNEQASLSRTSTFKSELPAYGKFIVHDINKDDKDDLIVIYKTEKYKGYVSLLVSQIE